MIRVLIVEDSATVRMLLMAMLESDPAIQVVGTAANGLQAVQQALALKPDLITMDIHMPVMNGYEATQLIMEQCPTPIVVVSSIIDSHEPQNAFNVIQAGALDVVQKPPGMQHADFENIREQLITKVKLMAEMKVIRSRPPKPASSFAKDTPPGRERKTLSLLAIGASTGGPAALSQLLKTLPPDFRLPVVVAQHISVGFTQGLVQWLQVDSPMPLHIAEPLQRIQPGEVYFAPDNYHLVFVSRDVLGFNFSPPVHHVRPSVTVLFESAAKTYGAEVIGVLLTGMGEDGASGLKMIHDRGGVTLVQDEATSVVYGMPRVAVELGAADYILPLNQIGATIMELVRVSH